MARFLLLLALLLFGAGEARAQFSSVSRPLPGDAGAAFINSYPARQMPGTYGGKGDARSSPATYSVPNSSKSSLYLDAQYLKNGTMTCNGTTSVVFTPTINAPDAGFPAYLPLEGATNRILTGATGTNCGSFNHLLNVVTALSGGSQTLTFDAAVTGTGTDTVVLCTSVSGMGNGCPVTLNSVSDAFQSSGSSCTIAGGAATITGCPATLFVTNRDLTLGSTINNIQIRAIRTYIHIRDDSGACVGPAADGGYDAMIQSATTTTAVTLQPLPVPGMATPASAYAFPCPGGIAAPNMTISWGSFLFRGDDVARTIDIPFAGAVSTAIDQPVQSLVDTVSAFNDPMSITLSAPVTTVPATNTYGGAQLGQLLIGTDDTTADDNMALAIYGNGYRIGYWPPNWNSFEASPSLVQVGNLQNIVRQGEGGVAYPESAPQYVFVGAASGAPRITVPQAPSASASLRNYIAQSGTRVVAEAGDSMLADGINGLGYQGSLGIELYNYLAGKTGIPSQREQFSIGGQAAEALAPLGTSQGNGAGIPSLTCTSRPPWYQGGSNCTTQWLSLVEAQNPAAIVMDWAGNELYKTDLAAYENIVQTTQAPAWLTATGQYPDLIWLPVTNIGMAAPGVNNSYVAAEYAMRGIRSLIDSQAPQIAMANGGSVWLGDIGRQRDLLLSGFDPTNEPTEVAVCATPLQVPGSKLSIALPYTMSCQADGGYGVVFQSQVTGTLSAYTLWSDAIGGGTNPGGLCYLTGGGGYGTPYVFGTQTGALQEGYPYGELCWHVDSATGDYFVDAYLYRLPAQSAVVSITSGTKSLGSTTAIANAGYGGATITLTGSGCTSVLPASETIAYGGISTNGKTLTLAANAIGTATAVTCSVNIFQTLFLDVNTGVPATVSTATSPTQQQILFQMHGDYATLSEVAPLVGTSPRDIWEGHLFAFGGFFYPVVTAYDGAAHSSNELFLPNSNLPKAWIDRPEVARLPQMMTASEMWGQPYNAGIIVGPFGGQTSAHESTFGAAADHIPVLEAADWNPVAPAPVPVPLTSGASLTAGCGQIIQVNDTTAPTVTLPAYCLSTMPVTVRDVGGNASTHTITLTAPATLTLNGSAGGSQTITSAYAQKVVTWNSATNAVAN